MKHLVFLCMALAALLQGTAVHAQKKTFVRDYTYQAGEADSKLTARANATTQMRNILLSEVGQYLHVERTLKQDDTSEEFSQKIEAITAGIVEMKTLDEQWDGATYYIKAEMAVDPKDLERRIAEVLNDKQKTQELEEARKRTLAAEAENARLRKELEATKDEQQRLDLQKTYTKAADALSAEEYFTKGNNARENRFYELAIEYYQQAVTLDPSFAAAYHNMGTTYDDLENYNEAIRCYKKALDFDPSLVETYNNMGIVYNRYLDDCHEAMRCFQKALELDPNSKRVYYNMGSAYRCFGNEQEAMRCYQKAIDIDPNYSMAYQGMGLSYHRLENYRKSIQYYEKAIKLDPNSAMSYYVMGLSYALSGNDRKAIKNLQQAARMGHSGAQETLRELGERW
jgi:tetratricopeptide (TPR) repeat protein